MIHTEAFDFIFSEILAHIEVNPCEKLGHVPQLDIHHGDVAAQRMLRVLSASPVALFPVLSSPASNNKLIKLQAN